MYGDVHRLGHTLLRRIDAGSGIVVEQRRAMFDHGRVVGEGGAEVLGQSGEGHGLAYALRLPGCPHHEAAHGILPFGGRRKRGHVCGEAHGQPLHVVPSERREGFLECGDHVLAVGKLRQQAHHIVFQRGQDVDGCRVGVAVGRLEPGKGPVGSVGFHVGPQLVGEEAVGPRERLVEPGEGRGYGRSVLPKARQLGERAEVLPDDFFVEVGLHGIPLPPGGGDVHVAYHGELGEGGGVPGRKRVAVGELAACGKSFVIQD